LLLNVLNDKGGPLGFLEVHGLSVLRELDCINPDKVDLALECLSDILERVSDGLLILAGGINKDIGEGKTGFSVGGVVLAGNLVDKRGGVFL
jgi:hypothetical protein